MKKTMVLFLCIILYGNGYAQQAPETYTLQQLQARFKHDNYTQKVLQDFQNTMLNLREKPQIYEDIPGEILSWYTLNGQFSWHKTYLIKNDNLTEVETIPKDAMFLTKLNSYVPQASKFAYGSGLWSFAFVKKKGQDNYYLINATVKSFNSHPDIPNEDILMYDLEYKTNDFTEFQLVRFKDSHAHNWTEVTDN